MTQSCPACPSRDGVFKKTLSNRWGGLAHVVCTMFVPGAGFAEPETLEKAGFEFVDPALKEQLRCSLCTAAEDKRYGFKTQCAHKKCTTAFHVTCAQRAGLNIDFEDTSVYCKKHTPGATPAGRANGNGRGGKAKQQRKRKRS